MRTRTLRHIQNTRMERFFVSKSLVSVADVDFETSEIHQVVAIRPRRDGFEVESTLFDFSIGILHPHHAYNTILRRVLCKRRVDGFITNVLKPGRNCNEVTQADYEALKLRLHEKSRHMWRKKRRKQVFEEVNE